MDKHTATEISYKNGYTQGRIDATGEVFAEIENFLIQTENVIDRSLDEAVREDKLDVAAMFTNERTLIVTIITCIAELKKKRMEYENGRQNS